MIRRIATLLLGLATTPALAGALLDDDSSAAKAVSQSAREGSDIRVAGNAGSDENKPLDIGFLTGTAPLKTPRDLSLFAPSAGAAPGKPLEGQLTVRPTAAGGGMRIIKDPYDYRRGKQLAVPPVLSITLVSDGAALVPATRGPIAADHPHWEWIVEPGATWTDPADGGWSRAALPISLQERNANCVHNGMLTFAYRAGAISRAVWEIAGETCAYLQADLWGAASTTFVPGPVVGSKTLLAAHAQEVAARLPTRPIAEITTRFAGVDASAFGSPLEVDPDSMTEFGVVADGVHWVGGCRTRHGIYPFCDVLDLPSYSTAKSVFAGLALMRLETLYPGAAGATIGTHVAACAGPRWSTVRLVDALDMATGNFDHEGLELDEGSTKMTPFFTAAQHLLRVRLACDMFGHQRDPGEAWAYHTADTYLLGTAMQDLLRRHAGPGADIYRDLIVDPMWRKLGLSPVTFDTRRSYDAARQPFTGWGMTFHRDDIARIAGFVAGGAIIDGRSTVDPRMLAAALQRDPADRGLEAGSETRRYQHGFWALDIGAAIGCAKPIWVPYMSGYGGIIVAMFPNGVIYHYFSDGNDRVWQRAAQAADRMAPMCGK